MYAVQSISRHFFRLLDSVNQRMALTNRLRMARWAAEVERIIRTPPGCDDGFTAEQIERYAQTDFSKFSTWSIVCEEVLDTTFPCSYFAAARCELQRRGITDDEYENMRRLAWLTAGWLNYEKMLWDWHHLDEHDVKRAIEWQFKEGWISQTEHDRRLDFAERYRTIETEGTADER